MDGRINKSSAARAEGNIIWGTEIRCTDFFDDSSLEIYVVLEIHFVECRNF